MIKVMVIFGTRPEAIKLVPVIKELETRSETVRLVTVSTGQHKEMLEQVLKEFSISPNYNLNLMKDNQNLNCIFSNIMSTVSTVLEYENPDIVLVHGDTTTTLAASLAAFHQKIKIGHIEAGLRTYNKYSPFPEEINRQLTDQLADLYFAPTMLSAQNLINEKKSGKDIFVTGNTVIDIIKNNDIYFRNKINFQIEKKILLTMHRRENIGVPMEQVFKALCRILNKHKYVSILFPMHKNPKVRELAYKYFSENKRVELVEPAGVKEFYDMISSSYLVLTDSGGIQEEVPSFNIPVLVLRDTTERTEGIVSGVSKLIGTNEEKVYKEVDKFLEDKNCYQEMCKNSNPYGDGQASRRIVDNIILYVKKEI